MQVRDSVTVLKHEVNNAISNFSLAQ